MKKIILIIVILFCITCSYAQDTKPTKQETMDWIGKTLLKYLPKEYYSHGEASCNQYNMTYKDGTFSYSSKCIIYLERNEKKYIIEDKKIFLSKIMEWEYEGKGWKLTGTNMCYAKEFDSDSKELITDNYSHCYINVGWQDGFNFVDENNIKERFTKAISNLVDYNKQSLPKEAY